MQRTRHKSPVCGCRSTFTWDDEKPFAQTFAGFVACALHPEREGRAGYVAAQADTFAIGFAIAHVKAEAGLADDEKILVEYDGTKMLITAPVGDADPLRATLTEKQADRDYRLPCFDDDDRESIHESIGACLLACRLRSP